ncbi:helix-turn-helix transcriptional regulator [Streptomyces sp. NBC_00828]|uniref:hypothetical protein n=1 Tax=Streptomyces sp. NBC_00828 TaxID=2903678 RepID=UPI00386F25D9
MNHDPTAWRTLGTAIRDDRNRQGLTREELSDLTAERGRRVSARTIGSIERGVVPERGTKPPTLEPTVNALGWKPGWADRILAGEDPAQVLGLGGEANDSPRSRLLELVPGLYEFSRTAANMGADPRLRDEFDQLVQRILAAVPGENPARSYGLAAYRPHAEGEGVPADDAARIREATRGTR